ncbi:MFS transporter [Saccharospirillum sp. HFRX-1]|uniref:MFS transporter n=1 Tax=unclassified Saccharospirillum TaxID=2633430 RepID=UPI003716CC42
MPSTSPAATAPINRRASLAVALGTLIAVLDLGMVNLALPSMAAGLSIAESQAVWISTSYQLVCAASLMLASGLSYVIGRKRLYLAGLLLFAAGASLALLADSFAWLIVARIWMGLGGAALLSLGPALLRTIYPANRLGQALAINALVVATGLAGGPSLAGVILYLADWPWIFALNLPLALTALWLSATALTPEPAQRRRFDWLGGLYSALLMACLLLSLERLGHGADSWIPVLLLVTAALALALFVRRERRASYPLVPLSIFRRRRFSLAILVTLLAFTAQGLTFVALSFLYQSDFQHGPLMAAMLFSPWPIALLVSGPLAGRLSDRLNPAALSTAGLALFVVGLLLLLLGAVSLQLPLLLVASVISGLGYGFFQAPNNHEVMAQVELSLSSTASGVLATVRTLGQSLGSASFALAWSVSPGAMLWPLLLALLISLAATLISLRRLRH